MVTNACSEKKNVDVIHIISGDLWAGAEVQVFHTLCSLQRVNQISFFTVLFNNGILANKLRKNGIKFIIVDESKHNGISMIWQLTSILRKLKPKILHVHAYKEHILGKMASIFNNNKTRIVRTFHGNSEAGRGLPLFKSIRSNIVHKIEKIFMKNCNLIAVSKDLEKTLRANYPNAFVVQIYNGIPMPETKSFVKEQVKRKYGVNKDTFWIGTLVRLEKIKNLGMLIDAGKELIKADFEFKISIFGEGLLRKALQNRIKDNRLEDYICLEGFVEDIIPILGSLDVFVLCSLHEGMPMSLLEAMFVGTPVICTSVGGMKEVITNRHSGLLIPSNDASALYKTIIEMKNNTGMNKNLVKNAKKELTRNFSIQRTNQKLVRLYKDILCNSET